MLFRYSTDSWHLNYATRVFENFWITIEPHLMRSRVESIHFVMVAEMDGCVVGMNEVRNCDHISLFYMDENLQR